MMKAVANTQRRLGMAVASLTLFGWSITTLAQEQDAELLEEVLVTAQRVAESIQDVPIAVTALTDQMLRERQVITPSDLQLNAPNVAFSATNFGSSSLSIRGVGNLAIGRTAEAGVSSHLNEIALPTNLNIVEFFDMERVEVLRGPQSTLFGRNATGGAINFVTRKPELGRVAGFFDLEAGDYSHQRIKGAVNLPLGRRAALRLAGYHLDRDGYIENLAHGQTNADGNTLPGIDGDIDGRDIMSLRATFAWEISDSANVWLLYSRQEEDDDRARITNQICQRNPLPTSGCTPNGFGWDAPHIGATTAGLFSGLAGAIPLGASGADPSLFDFPRPSSVGFRRVHTDFDPIFEDKEEIVALGFEREFKNYHFSLIGGYRESEYLSRQDYIMEVGPMLAATEDNPLGHWPISRPAGGAGEEWRSPTCNLNDATSGLAGDCYLPIQGNRAFAYDQQDSNDEAWSVEAKLHSTFDAPWNFLFGISQNETTSYGGYYVFANGLDLAYSYGAPGTPPLYPGFFYNSVNPDEGAHQEGWAAFSELYLDFTERLKITVGVRTNDDTKRVSDSSVLFNSLDASQALGGLLGLDPVWIRSGLFGEMVAMASNPGAILSTSSQRLLEFHAASSTYTTNAPIAIGAIAAIGAAQDLGSRIASGDLSLNQLPGVIAGLPLTPTLRTTVATILSSDPQAIAADAGLMAGVGAFNAIAGAIPPVPGFGETRFITQSPSKASWAELSGRVGFDLQLASGNLLYGFYSRGYKPGGFNPGISPAFQASSPFTFDPEEVNAVEVGLKGTFLDGQLTMNGAFFAYDYTDLQISRIRNNTSINDNIDATITGAELEGVWRPRALSRLALDFAYGWLDSEVGDSQSLDPINRTGSNADYVLLNNIDSGSLLGVNYVARESQINQAVLQAALAASATIPVAFHPENAAGVAVPVYFSREFLTGAGVETLDGVPVDLNGNQLPNSPEHSLKLGLAYTWNVAYNATLTGRWDWYWQGESYAREFNTVGDEIDSWSQHNASLIYQSEHWTAKAWVRNVMDDDNVTGKYLTSDTSGFFRNYFLTEPRIFGVSLRREFGSDTVSRPPPAPMPAPRPMPEPMPEIEMEVEEEPPPPPPPVEPVKKVEPPKPPTGLVLLFDFDKAVVKAGALSLLTRHAKFLRENSDWRIRIEGHADDRGPEAYNLRLGDMRAKAVRDALISMGVSRTRIETISYGEQRPSSIGTSDRARARNRRSVIIYLTR